MAATTRKWYPADFVRRVKAEYPDWLQLHGALDSGSQFVGRYLSASSSAVISPGEIVKMIDSERIQELRYRAAQLVRRQKLYDEWGRIAESMFYGR